MEWTRKAEKSEKTVEERKKAETKRVTEKRKFLAQNFQKVGILFILKEPPASPRGYIQDYFPLAYECTKYLNMKLLQIKFLHNTMLQKMGVTNTNRCHWCPEVDYIEHAFYGCSKLTPCWHNGKQYLLTKYNIKITVNEKIAPFGITKALVPSNSQSNIVYYPADHQGHIRAVTTLKTTSKSK